MLRHVLIWSSIGIVVVEEEVVLVEMSWDLGSIIVV